RGLGLAAVQGIIRSHHGRLSVVSTAGKGSTFSVLFPVLTPAATIGDATAVPQSAPRKATGTVLIVDDEEPIRSFARRALERAGYRVLDASDGAKAMGLFRAHAGEIGVVILDLTMPVMDGRQVLGQLRAIDPDVSVVLSSGFSEH